MKRKKKVEFYWVNKDEGTFFLNGEVHNLAEYDLNEVFRGSGLKDGIMEKHYRAVQLMREIDENCFYT